MIHIYFPIYEVYKGKYQHAFLIIKKNRCPDKPFHSICHIPNKNVLAAIELSHFISNRDYDPPQTGINFRVNTSICVVDIEKRYDLNYKFLLSKIKSVNLLN